MSSPSRWHCRVNTQAVAGGAQSSTSVQPLERFQEASLDQRNGSFQLLNSLLGFIQFYASPSQENTPVTLGIMLALGLFFTSVITAFLKARLQAQTVNLGLEVHTALISMVYHKSLRLSNAAKNETPAGQITNLVCSLSFCWREFDWKLRMWWK